MNNNVCEHDFEIVKYTMLGVEEFQELLKCKICGAQWLPASIVKKENTYLETLKRVKFMFGLHSDMIKKAEDEQPVHVSEDVDKADEFEGKFIELLINELHEYGIDTSTWEYEYGDCCYGGAIEFISRCIKGYAEKQQPNKIDKAIELENFAVEIRKRCMYYNDDILAFKEWVKQHLQSLK